MDIDIIEMLQVYSTIHCLHMIKYISKHENIDIHKLLSFIFK